MNYNTAKKRSRQAIERIMKRNYTKEQLDEITDYASFKYHRGSAYAYGSKPQLADEESEFVIIPRKEIENRHIIISILYDANGDKWMREVRNTLNWLLNYNKE